MCNDARVFSAGTATVTCGTQGELAAALGCDLPLRDGYHSSARKDRICLCPIDIEALAHRIGAKCESPSPDIESDHFDVWAIRLRS